MTSESRSGSASSTIRTTTKRRYWRRTDTPRPWWPWGLMPAVGLGLLFLFGAFVMAPDIQAEVRTSVGEHIERTGARVGAISADGQHVTARVAAEGQQDMILAAVAKSSTCETWAGALRCPAAVDIEREVVDGAPAVAEQRPHPFEVVRDGDSIVLRGEVPTAPERDRIVGLAGGYFGQVDDQLTITDKPAGGQYAHAADRALAVARHLTGGRASWSGERLSVSGTAAAESATAARAAFEGDGASGILGDFDVQALGAATPAIDGCNEAFADAFADTSIRFRTGSAEIEAGNETLLAQLAELARACQGSLRIEGHTDSSGDADMNKALSLARAGAVRDSLAALGVDAERVVAVGYGETRPIADNGTADGRAKNRRIAILVNDSE